MSIVLDYFDRPPRGKLVIIFHIVLILLKYYQMIKIDQTLINFAIAL